MPSKLGILAEDQSDVDTLKIMARRIAGDPSLTIKGKGFDGCAHLLRKGAAVINLLIDEGFTHFVVCHDAGENDPAQIAEKVRTTVVNRSAVSTQHIVCIVVPVQEIEAWLLSDGDAIEKVISGCDFDEVGHPEKIRSPKEHLEKLSRKSHRKPRYNHTVHNPRIAEHLDFEKVRFKCPSFRGFSSFVVDFISKLERKN